MSDELRIPWPTLGHLLDGWYEQHLVIPDGYNRGEPFTQARWQYWATANHYRIREDATFNPQRPPGSRAFVYRRSLIIGPQKSGKGPWSAGVTAGEAVGPTQFIGWARRGDAYRCEQWGCHCGWEWEYEVGDPMGGRHPSPLIQLTALAQAQVDNVYGPLTEMVAQEPLASLLQQREDFIRVIGSSAGGKRDRIDVVTSKARTKLGQPISFALQDELALWTEPSGMKATADTQNRGAAGMNGRTMGTTNPPDPSEHSVAQDTIEAAEKDVFVYWDEPPSDLRFDVPDERRQLLEYVYRDCPWISVDAIEAEAKSIALRDPGQAERFFGNRMVRGKGRWLADMEPWKNKLRTRDVAQRLRVCLGFDGSKSDDWTAIRLETLDMHQFTPTWNRDGEIRPAVWKPEEHNGRIPRDEVREAMSQIFARYDVVRGYYDPYWWDTEIAFWADQFGAKRVIEWHTASIKKMHAALERFRRDILDPESRLTHDTCPSTHSAAQNAIVRVRPGEAYILGKPDDAAKIDPIMSSTLAHEAVCDVLAAGLATDTTTLQVSDAMYGFS